MGQGQVVLSRDRQIVIPNRARIGSSPSPSWRRPDFCSPLRGCVVAFHRGRPSSIFALGAGDCTIVPGKARQYRREYNDKLKDWRRKCRRLDVTWC